MAHLFPRSWRLYDILYKKQSISVNEKSILKELCHTVIYTNAFENPNQVFCLSETIYFKDSQAPLNIWSGKMIYIPNSKIVIYNEWIGK